MEDPTTLIERESHFEDLAFGERHNAEGHLRRVGAARREDRERTALEYEEAEGVDDVEVRSNGRSTSMAAKTFWLPSALEAKAPGKSAECAWPLETKWLAKCVTPT